jgi:hypothetical protein
MDACAATPIVLEVLPQIRRRTIQLTGLNFASTLRSRPGSTGFGMCASLLRGEAPGRGNAPSGTLTGLEAGLRPRAARIDP